MKKAALLFLCVVGCAPTVQQVSAPSGEPASLITCRDYEDCLTAATKQCNGGPYDIVDSRMPSKSTTVNENGKLRTTNTNGQMLIKCKSPAVAAR